MSNVVLKVEKLNKTFKLPHEAHSGIKQRLVNVLKHKRGYELQHVLKNISFEIEEGDFFGIVGRNGSGKSTLLKLMAGIYTPDTGKVDINGSLVPFIELGVGFNPELTGRENIFLNGALLGFSRKEMKQKYDSIVEFSELERFMDQKLKNYSSGMQVRLAFSIAIRAKGDILLLDEVLAVGDAAFQQKCFDYFEQLKKNKKTVILVTHDMSAVKRFCNRAILIEDGEIKDSGTPESVADQYLLDNVDTGHDSTVNQDANKKLESSVKDINFKTRNKKKMNRDDTLEFEIGYTINDSFNPIIGYTISKNGIPVIEMNSRGSVLSNATAVKHTVAHALPLEALNPGAYKLDVAIFNEDMSLQGYILSATQFVVEGNDRTRGGFVYANGVWTPGN
ncbi:MAG: ABC transporter ATP-binding protein [Candidatus Saccharimonadales bacterium]